MNIPRVHKLQIRTTATYGFTFDKYTEKGYVYNHERNIMMMYCYINRDSTVNCVLQEVQTIRVSLISVPTCPRQVVPTYPNHVAP